MGECRTSNFIAPLLLGSSAPLLAGDKQGEQGKQREQGRKDFFRMKENPAKFAW
ncbi:MAG: hypothetical protein AAFY21_01880 [Cyanobacteria bacterium J06641_2]